MQNSEEQLAELSHILGAKKVIEPGHTLMTQTLTVITSMLVLAAFAFGPLDGWYQQQALTGYTHARNDAHKAAEALKASGKRTAQDEADRLAKAEEVRDDFLLNAAVSKADTHFYMFAGLMLLLIVTTGVIQIRSREDNKNRSDALRAATLIFEDITGAVKRPAPTEIERIVRRHIPKDLEADVTLKAKRVYWLLFGPRVAGPPEAE